MDKKEGEQKNILIHWWNFDKKTLDFNGPIKDYLEKKDIKVSRISHKEHKEIKGYRFKIPVSSSHVTLDTFDQDYIYCVDKAIIIFLTMLGDKTRYSAHNRDYKINWR